MSRVRGPEVRTGLEVLLADPPEAVRGRRLGLIANPASIDSCFRSTARAIAGARGLELCALFGPEHGFASGLQDMIAVEGETDEPTGLRVHTLYGKTVETLAPTGAMLDGIDLLIADLQDVGARYYTFAATIALALEAAAKRGIRLLVLDRPNPLGGVLVEGPRLEAPLRSFVGHIDVPVRHGLTMGELLTRHAHAHGWAGSLEVVRMTGWTRGMSWADTGLPWVPPSPNMPTVETALVYPGTCLLEATNLSEGRGTTRPFEWVGAPFLNSEKLAGILEDQDLPGVVFRPHTFVPSFHKWAGQSCGGVAVHVTDPARFQPVRMGVALLLAARRLAPSRFAWRSEPYEFVSDRPAIDLLTGSEGVRGAVEKNLSLQDATAGWEGAESSFRAARAPSLLYT